MPGVPCTVVSHAIPSDFARSVISSQSSVPSFFKYGPASAPPNLRAAAITCGPFTYAWKMPSPALSMALVKVLSSESVRCRGVARLREGVDRGQVLGYDRPAVELFVDELVRRVGSVAFPHGALERTLVLRLRQGHDLVGMIEIEHHDVQLGPERGLEIFLPVEPVLEQLLLDRVDRLLFVRELVRELVDRVPLRGVQVGVDRDEQRDQAGTKSAPPEPGPVVPPQPASRSASAATRRPSLRTTVS